jgi:zinc transporter, ZIP family
MALKAALWGLLAGSTLVLGALVGLYARKVNRRVIAVVTAFGAGVLISTLAFNLMDEAYGLGGFDSSTLGFLVGAALFICIDWVVYRTGGRAHKAGGRARGWEDLRADEAGPETEMEEEVPVEAELAASRTGGESGGNSMAIFIGALLDGIPESAAIGVGLLAGKSVGFLMVVAVFLSNFPEAVSGAADMRKVIGSKARILLMWAAVAVASSLSSLFGYLVLGQASQDLQAFSLALAAGAVLATVSSSMIPEAYRDEDRVVPIGTPLATVAGFMLAFILTKLSV